MIVCIVLLKHICICECMRIKFKFSLGNASVSLWYYQYVNSKLRPNKNLHRWRYEKFQTGTFDERNYELLNTVIKYQTSPIVIFEKPVSKLVAYSVGFFFGTYVMYKVIIGLKRILFSSLCLDLCFWCKVRVKKPFILQKKLELVIILAT